MNNAVADKNGNPVSDVRKLPRREVAKIGGIASAVAPVGKGLSRAAARDSDVIVIGAGASGSNTAWHLRQSNRSVLVLEAGPVAASEASRAAAGFVAHWSGLQNKGWGRTEWQMEDYGIQFYTNLARQCGRDIGFARCGIAFIYTKPENWKLAQLNIQQARELGTNVEVLTETRAREILPEIRFDTVAGILFDPDSIRVRASEAIPCLAEESAKYGARFEYSTPARAFLRDGDRIVGVRTDHGDLYAPSVVVAAGAWSRPLLSKAGADCPTTPVAEIRYTTRPLPGVRPNMPTLMFDEGFYIREEQGGLLIGGGDSHEEKDRQIDPDNPPTADLLPHGEVYRIREHLHVIEGVMPIVEHAEIDKIAAGIPTYTSDQRFIADAVPNHPGLYVLSGCQEAGITHGPGLGRMIAELITTGKTTWDQSRYQLTRFGSEA